MSTLLLWLEAPLQSWGADSSFDRRDTLPFPTRSGILGLLCCAAGRGGEQTEWLRRMAEYHQTIIAYSLIRKNEPLYEPLLYDFQMVGSAYDISDPWQDMLVPKKIDGSRPVGTGTKMTYRYYIQDMAFACVLDIPEDLSQELAEALAAPVWSISLGRKCCPPADTVFRGVFPNKDAALEKASSIAEDKKRTSIFTVLDEELPDQGDVMTLNDVPICFGTHKRYRDRYVTIVK